MPDVLSRRPDHRSDTPLSVSAILVIQPSKEEILPFVKGIEQDAYA